MTTAHIGNLVRQTRTAMKVTQQELALTSGTGQRFISDLENGKDTCQIGKVLVVLQNLGIEVVFNEPNTAVTSNDRHKP